MGKKHDWEHSGQKSEANNSNHDTLSDALEGDKKLKQDDECNSPS
jgi:hypothetical protein